MSASSKPPDVQRIEAVLRRLTRNLGTMTLAARKECMKKATVWLDEFNRVKGHD